MKTVKRVFCLFLALTLCLSFFPMTASAEGKDPFRGDADLELQAENSLGRALLNSINRENEEAEQAGPCHVNGVTVEDGVVTVSYDTDEDAQVLVAIYEDAIYDDDPDVLKLLTTVTAEAPAELDLAVAELSEEIPETFIVGAYLLRTGSHEPLCEEYVSRYYTAEFQAFLNAPVSEYEAAGDRLVVFTPGEAPDGSDANFGVLAEDVVILRETEDLNHLTQNEDGSYTVTAAEAAALALQDGDKLAHWSLEQELTLAYVTGLTVEGDSVTLTDDPDAEADVFFEIIRINADTSGAEQTLDCSDMDDGVTVLTDEDVGAEVDQIFAEAEARAAEEAAGEWKPGESGIISPETGIPEAAGNTAELDGAGQVAVLGSPPGTHTVSTDLKLDVDLFKYEKEGAKDEGEINVKLSFKGALTFQYYISPSWQYISTELNKSISITGSIKGKFTFVEIPLPTIRVPLFPGINAAVAPKFTISFEAQLSFTIAWEEKSGFEYDSSRPKGSEWKEISSKTGLKPKTSLKLEGTLKIGFKIEVGIEVLSEKVGFVSLNIEPGVEVKGSMSTTDDVGDTDPTAESLHDCDLCLSGEINFYVKVSVELKILKDILKDRAKLTWDVCDYHYKICDFYASLSGGSFAFGLGRCPNRRYRLTLTTLSDLDLATKTVAIGNLVQLVEKVSYNYDVTPFLLKNMAVSITSTDGKYVQDAELITGEDGSISVFLPCGDYRIKAYGSGYFGEQTFKIEDKAREYYMVLEESEKKEGNVTDKDGAVIHWDYYIDGILILSGNGEIPDYTDISYPPWRSYAQGYEGYKKVQTIIIRNGITRVGNWAFEGYDTVTDLQIGATVTEIGEDAFRGFHEAERVSIPRSVTSIRENAFKGWLKLKEVVYDGNKKSWRTLKENIESGNEPLLNAKLIFNASILDSGQCGDNLYWTLSSNGTLTVTGSGPMWDLAEEKEQWWYEDREDIEVLILESGMTRLGERAFSGCGQLTEVAIPGTVTEIGSRAFEGCEKLVTVSLPDGLETIPAYAFKDCKSLLEITIPFSVMRIGYGAFSGCTKMQSTGKRSKSVRYLGMQEEWDEVDVAGGNAPLLAAIATYSDNTIDLGSCGPDLKAKLCGFDNYWILIVEGDGKITDGAITSTPWKNSVAQYSTDFTQLSVKGTDLIADLRLPEGVSRIPDSAFANCEKLTHVTIPGTVTSVGQKAFANCSGLMEITFPKSVERFGHGVLYGCDSLTSLTVPFVGSSRTANGTSGSGSSGNIVFCTLRGFFYNYNGARWDGTFPSELKTVRVTDATQLADYAFCNSSIPSIPRHAPQLTSLELNDGITSIGNYAFYYQSELLSLSIPSALTSIGKSAFCGCSLIRSLELPDTVTVIPEWAFAGCAGLKSFDVKPTVTSVGQKAFANCSGLTEITFPKSVESFGHGVLYGCDGLTSLTVPFVGSSRTANGTSGSGSSGNIVFCTLRGFFYNYNGAGWDGSFPSELKKVKVTDAVQLADNAFCNSSVNAIPLHAPKLTSLTLNNGITSIGARAFYGQSALTDLNFGGSMAQWQAITIASGNDVLSNITIHCSDGNLALEPAEDLEDLEEPKDEAVDGEDGEIKIIDEPTPTDEPVPTDEPAPIDEPDPTDEPDPADDPDPVPEPEPEPEPVPGNGGRYVSLASFAGAESPDAGSEAIYTASFGGLVPGEEYLVLAVRSADELGLLDNGNILFVGQKTAGEDGTLTIRYVKKSSEAAVLRCYGMSDKSFADADKLNVVLSLGVSDSKAYTLAVAYDGTELEENKDYLASFTPLEDDVVEITLKGIRDYSGAATILAKVSCTEEATIDGYAVIHTAHSWGDWGVSTPAGCENPGEEHRLCAGCGKEETRELEAIGHEWGEPAWTWAEDFTSAEARFVCSHDPEHIRTLEGEISEETTEKGILYTAVAAWNGETYTDQLLRAFVTVSFDAGDGAEPDSVKIFAGESLEKLPTPEREGTWLFLGWFTEPASGLNVGKGTQVTEETCFDEDSTVYAHWRLPGDINGDETVNNKDVTRLIRYIKYSDVAALELALDTNGDGAVNNKDVTRLIRFIKYKDVVIH